MYSTVNGNDQKSIQDIQGALITLACEAIFTNSYAVIYDFPAQLPLIRRETGEKLYPFSAFYVANFIRRVNHFKV